MFEAFLAQWGLALDGDPVTTQSSDVLPVCRDSLPAMLKVARGAEEARGAATMIWWDGEGAAKVLAHDGAALLMERAEGPNSLIHMARSGRDDEASLIICAATARLHSARGKPHPETLVPLMRWFEALPAAAARHGGILDDAATTARDLLASPRDSVVLHGDIHHGNILDFGARGWLAIDPKGLVGERGFDYANLFCNPDAEVALAPGRLRRQAAVVAEAVGIDWTRLLQWVLAYAGLSAAWSLGDGDSADLALSVAQIAAGELGR